MAEQRWTIYVCPECGEHLTEREWDEQRSEYNYGHYHDPPPDWPEDKPDPEFIGEPVQVVPASVLEERDRTIQTLRDECVELHADYDALSGLYEACREAELEATTEAESLRSQLTEARALWPETHARIGDLRGMCTDELPHEQLDAKLSELDDLLYEGLVPAPQDREPTT